MWTSLASIWSAAATSFCSQCGACEGDQISALPPFTSATAHDGPIEPWVWTAKSYVALIFFAAPAMAAFGSPRSTATSSLAIFDDRTCSQIFDGSGSPSHFDHVAFSARAAFTAAHSLSATTARKLP